MKIKNKLTKIGRNPKKNKGYINPPIYKGSTIIFDDFKSYIKDRDKTNDNEKSKYGIQFNPTREFLENAITSLYDATDTVTTPSGLTALAIPFLTFLNKGNHVLMSATSEEGNHVWRGEVTHMPSGTFPLGWTRKYGDGKVFVVLLGHNGLSFQTPEFQQVVLNGVSWVTS